jgi:hypothetical protein
MTEKEQARVRRDLFAESDQYWKGLVLKHKSRIGINRRIAKIARTIDDLQRERDDLIVAKRYITKVLGPTA